MSEAFDELVSVMERLRAPGGCPWDREQTYGSLGQYLIEETYEAYEAIRRAEETGSTEDLCEELGDVLLQVVFHSTIARERGDFTIDDVAGAVAQKLILRHPHVFGDEKLETADEVLQNWDELKEAERAKSGKKESRDDLLDDVPESFPSLLEAQKITGRAAKVGFDWTDTDQIISKLHEELRELDEASGDPVATKEEVGDLLFVVVNLARKLGVDAETALKDTNRKFRKRFGFIENELRRDSRTLDSADLSEMDRLWERAKEEMAGGEQGESG